MPSADIPEFSRWLEERGATKLTKGVVIFRSVEHKLTRDIDFEVLPLAPIVNAELK